MRARCVVNVAAMVAVAGTARAQLDEPFPAVFELSSLSADNGGDGTLGIVIEGILLGDRAGFSAASIGDLNGDGVDDLLIGAYRADPNGMSVAGEAYVVFGRASGEYPAELALEDLDGANGFEVEGLDVGDQIGRAVSSAGDINHDGFDDLAIGASLADPDGRINAGITYIIYGRDAINGEPFPRQFDLDSLDGTIGFRIDGVEAEEIAGVGVERAGDVNGDGIDDLVVGADYADPGGRYSAGRSYVVFGRDTANAGEFPAAFQLSSLDGTNGFAMHGAGEGDRSGGAVAGIGDVNGDGLDDVIVGARQADPLGREDAGAGYVVFGRPGAFPPAIELAALNGEDGFAIAGVDFRDRLGVAVGAAGDINGDGIGDLVIGAYYADPGGRAYAGESYVVYGRDTRGGEPFEPMLDLRDLDQETGFRMSGLEAGDRNGYAVAALGDVNGDGRGDLVVGAAGASPDEMMFAGTSYVIYGRDAKDPFPAEFDLASLDGTTGFRIEGVAPSDRSGSEVFHAGDFNNDGTPDLGIGAWFADPGGGRPTAGQTSVIFGRTRCAADLDGDGDADSDDFFAYLDAFASGDMDTCNLDGDADCDSDDFFAYLDRFAGGC